jgi:hypothetical protein
MSAYSAIMLLKLLRSSAAAPFLQISSDEVYALIRRTAAAYKHTSTNTSEIISTVTHARFLENLVSTDILTRNQKDRGRHSSNIPVDPLLVAPSNNSILAQTHDDHLQQSHSVPGSSATFPSPVGQSSQSQPYNPDYLASPRVVNGPASPQVQAMYQYPGYTGNYQSLSEQDAHYQRLMFSETNFGEPVVGSSSPPQYVESRGYSGDPVYSQPSYAHTYAQPMHYPQPQSSVQSNFTY